MNYMTISRFVRLVLAGSAMFGAATAQAVSITWHDRPIAATLAEAMVSKRPVLLYFWMEGSDHCADLWNQTLAKPGATKDLLPFVCHSAKATSKVGRELVQRYRVTTLPTLLVVTPAGAIDDAVLGFVPPAIFASEMQRVIAGTQTVSSLRAAAAADPKDLSKRFALTQKLRFVGDRAGANALVESIRRDDPEGTTMAGAEVLLFDIRQKIIAAAPSKEDVTSWELKPMYGRLLQTKQKTVLFKGYSWLATTQGQRGDRGKQREAWRMAWPHAPAVQASEWGGEVLLNYWNQREDSLATKDRNTARSIAAHLLAEIEGDPTQTTKEQRAFLLRCAACGLAVGGKLMQARKLIKRAVELQPEDGELIALSDQLHQ